MSFPTTAPRLEFFDLPEDAPNPVCARVDAAVSGSTPDRGPARFHHLHGAIPIGRATELRITTQAASDGRPARLVIRAWQERPEGAWWPDARSPGVWVPAGDVQAFAEAVTEAARYLNSEAKP